MANQIVAGELYESITGQLFEIGRQIRQKSGYPHNPEQLKQALQAVVEGRFPRSAFELYLAPAQQNGGYMKGFDLEKHLVETGRIKRSFSLEDELVKGWLADPSTYPEELKGKAVSLWKSRRTSRGDRFVASLCWYDVRVIVIWDWLGLGWYGSNPALLASS